MKNKLLLFCFLISLLFVCSVDRAVASDTLIASHTASSGNWGTLSGGNYGIGQALTISGNWNVTSMKFYIKNTYGHSDNLYAKIWNATGTVGTNATGTGAALGTSDAYSMSSVGSSFAWHEFTFSTPVSISSGDYAVMCCANSASYPGICINLEFNATHAGNRCYWQGSTSFGYNDKDTGFYIYGIASSGWNEKINDITTQGKINDVEIADIAKVNDVEGD